MLSKPVDNPTAINGIIEVTFEGQTKLSSRARYLGDSPNCETETFVIAVEEALSDIEIGALQDNEELVSLTVSRDQSAECIFPFEVKIRIYGTCTDGSSCDPNAIGKSGMFVQFVLLGLFLSCIGITDFVFPSSVSWRIVVAQSVTQTITDSAANTSVNGLLAKVGDNGGDISGLTKAEATFDSDKVDIEILTGVTIKVVVMTDDHPSE